MHFFKIVTCAFLLFFSTHLVAQPGYSILYKRTHFNVIPGDAKAIVEDDLRYHLVVNDSFSFFYLTEFSRAKNKKWKEPGTPKILKELHHSYFFHRYKNELYNGVAFPNPRRPYLVRIEDEPAQVTIDSTPVQFMGLPCRKAFAVFIPGDTLFAVLSLQHPLPYGPMNYNYFPYIPLEVYRPRFRFQLIADKIEKGDYKLIFPSHLPIVKRGEKPPGGKSKTKNKKEKET